MGDGEYQLQYFLCWWRLVESDVLLLLQLKSFLFKAASLSNLF